MDGGLDILGIELLRELLDAGATVGHYLFLAGKLLAFVLEGLALFAELLVFGGSSLVVFVELPEFPFQAALTAHQGDRLALVFGGVLR